MAVCVPQAGHVTPLLPLLSACVTAGDDVLVTTGSDSRAAAESTGARWRNAGSGLGEWFARLAQRTRGAPGDGLAPERVPYYFVPRLFAEIGAADMVDDVLAAGRDHMPDLILFDAYSFCAPLAAELIGVPAVQHAIGPLLPADVLELAADALSPLWRSFGRDVPPHGGVYETAAIAICPPSLESGPPPRGAVLPLRPAPLPRGDVVSNARPLVYVTLGTLWSDPVIFDEVLTALADEPVDVLVTVGTALDPAVLGTVPANARVTGFVPQAEILPGCAAVVHHAGAGTMFGALAHGLPQVALPRAADNFVNAAMLERCGAGVALRPGDVGAEAVRAAIRTVLATPSYAAAARTVAAEIAAMAGPEDVAAQLRQLVASAG